ncbi:MAG: HlyD family efflux transporter periplasmic adaptor subunit [Sedimentisphaerales bacterium]|nr:HlyD family efflux transporter periplasmic adaptor subunit [Sedimentisphaerales bacterium]
MQSRYKMLSVVLLVTVLIVYFVSFSQTGEAQDVGFVRVDRFDQFLQAQKTVVLTAAVSGIVEEIAHEEQDFVKKGELLIKLDTERIEAEVEILRAQIRQNQEIATKEAQIKKAYEEDNWKIIRDLYELNPKEFGGTRVASEKEMKEATQRKDLAALAVQNVEYDRKLLELRLRSNLKFLEEHTIRSPIDGVIVPFSSVKNLEGRNYKRLEVGELIQTNLPSPAVAMMKVDRLQVRHDLPTEMLNKVEIGRTLRVFVEGETRPLDSTIVFISPTITTVGKFQINVEFENPLLENSDQLPEGTYPYRFRPGMRARVEFPEDL